MVAHTLNLKTWEVEEGQELKVVLDSTLSLKLVWLQEALPRAGRMEHNEIVLNSSLTF